MYIIFLMRYWVARIRVFGVQGMLFPIFQPSNINSQFKTLKNSNPTTIYTFVCLPTLPLSYSSSNKLLYSTFQPVNLTPNLKCKRSTFSLFLHLPREDIYNYQWLYHTEGSSSQFFRLFCSPSSFLLLLRNLG